ncbi:MAG: GNAT family N-acetyltransferase [Verrucomicrobiales bacterium]|nr:GNAT family N-acetyltransferase [Verrucomicrobiales bacterium]
MAHTTPAGQPSSSDGFCADPPIGDGEERDWNQFLLRSRLGSFQQFSLWAKVKAREGWTPYRSVFRSEGRVIGGYQWLERRKRVGRIAYVSKGPVLEEETEDQVSAALDDLVRKARERRLVALVLQPPDLSSVGERALGRRGFVVEDLMGVITTTLVVDLTGGMEQVEAGIRRSTRVEIRQSRQRGATVRLGGVADAARFFELMSATCVRQGVSPNPSSAEAVRDILETFGSMGCVRLTFAECEGQSVAGVLSLLVGSKIYIWKKGWNGQHARLYPNALLYQECLEWGCAQGYREVDFMGLDRRVADAMLGGEALGSEVLRSRDQFHLGFGGKPRRLPSSYLWIANPVVRFALGGLLARPWGRRVLKRMA